MGGLCLSSSPLYECSPTRRRPLLLDLFAQWHYAQIPYTDIHPYFGINAESANIY